MNYSKILSEDIESVTKDQTICWERLRDSSVLITGATGMIGRACARVLGKLNDDEKLNVVAYALGRNAKIGKELEQINGVTFLQVDLRETLEIRQPIDYVIHCAAVTKSAEMLADPVGLIETELSGSKNILELARMNSVRGFVYISSMEEYGLLDLPKVKESDQGYVDITKPRSSYPMCKRMVETMCNCYFNQYRLPTKIARLGMICGAGEDFTRDKRVWAQFAKCAYERKPIILHTEGGSLSSFAYLADASRAIFMMLLSDISGETYNVATCSCTIKEFAQKIGNKFGVEVKVQPPENVAKLGYASDFRMRLDTSKLKMLGWKPRVDTIEDMIGRIIEDEKMKC